MRQTMMNELLHVHQNGFEILPKVIKVAVSLVHALSFKVHVSR